MVNDNGYPQRILMVLLFVSSGFGGVPGGVKKSGLEPSRAQGPLPRVCEAILEQTQGGNAIKTRFGDGPAECAEVLGGFRGA